MNTDGKRLRTVCTTGVGEGSDDPLGCHVTAREDPPSHKAMADRLLAPPVFGRSVAARHIREFCACS
jgi:hypothetical protein